MGKIFKGMPMKKVLAGLGIIVCLLSACGPTMTPQQQVFLKELANRLVTCKKGDDCKEKWGRAVQWVSKHSGTGIREVNDNLITTNMVSDGSRPPFKYPEFTVLRYAKGKYLTIDFDSYCDHGFACNPTALQLRADFVTFVMGPPGGVTEVRPGVFQKRIPQ